MKSLKTAAGMGARDMLAFEPRIVFTVKSQMLHWLEFREPDGIFSTGPFFDHVSRGVQNQSAKRVETEKAPYLCPNSKMMALPKSTKFLNHFSKCIASCWLISLLEPIFAEPSYLAPALRVCLIYFPEHGGQGAAQRATDGSNHLPVSPA